MIEGGMREALDGVAVTEAICFDRVVRQRDEAREALEHDQHCREYNRCWIHPFILQERARERESNSEIARNYPYRHDANLKEVCKGIADDILANQTSSDSDDLLLDCRNELDRLFFNQASDTTSKLIPRIDAALAHDGGMREALADLRRRYGAAHQMLCDLLEEHPARIDERIAAVIAVSAALAHDGGRGKDLQSPDAEKGERE